MIPQIAMNAAASSAALSVALILHVGGGCLAILAGAAALSARKGERRHRFYGKAFVAAMALMCAFATGLSVLRQPGTIFAGIFTFYLVATAWAAVRRAPGTTGRFELVATAVALFCGAGELAFGTLASSSANGRFLGYPAPLYYVFGCIVLLAAAGDLRLILRGGVSGTARIVRHLWRMCFALFMATGSFFLGQQKVMPAFLHGSAVLVVLGLAPLAFMAYWLVRARSANALGPPASRAAAAAVAAGARVAGGTP